MHNNVVTYERSIMRYRGFYRSVIVTFAPAIAGILAMHCAKDSGVNPNASVSPTYSSISSVILQPVCVSCHNGGAGGYNFDTYANTMQSVKAGQPLSSPLFTAVKTGRMPQGGNSLSMQQIQAISDWITAGAANN
jgi:mono/diheme cytochrome c family protein